MCLGPLNRCKERVPSATVEETEVTLEIPGPRNSLGRFPHVPLAGHVGVVARFLEKLWQAHDGITQVAFVARHSDLVRGGPLVHIAEAVEVRVDTREQHRAGGRTARVSVKLGKAHALLRRASMCGVCISPPNEPRSE